LLAKPLRALLPARYHGLRRIGGVKRTRLRCEV